MKILFSKAKFEKAHYTTLFPLKCDGCGEIFYRTKKLIQDQIRIRKNNIRANKKQFCSNKCHGKNRTTSIDTVCAQCGKRISRQPNVYKKHKNYFCSLSCNTKYQNSHKTKGTNISKMEKLIQEQLLILYPNIEFHFNRSDTIKSELDIYIPSLKLAFELNGLFHYEPIFGNQKLNRTQNNDKRKFKLCIEHKISLCVINTSSIRYITKDKKEIQKFLDIITNIISEKQNEIT